jgi:tetratricopeptide (TPR) repeat protein
MSDSRTVTLVVKDANEGDMWRMHLYVDGDPVATNRTLTSGEVQSQRDLVDEYLSWFETGGLPLVEEDTLAAIGGQLFETWMADDWEDLESGLTPPGRSRFVVASDVPAVLNLPWSLLRLPGRDEALGLDPMSSVRLHPAAEQLTSDSGERRPGPLRVLYSACAPRDAGDLGYEKEEYQLLQTLTQPGHDVEHFGCDLGRFDELQDRVREYNPHVVHLTGHGVVADGEAHFAFENEEGYADLRPGNQIVHDALTGRKVQCVFVSGCETGQAPEIEATNGLCQDLVSNGVSLSVGWAASILDDVATEFGNTFYAELSAGEDVDRAVIQARRDARALCRERVEDDGVVDVSWTLPVLYTATTQADLFDPDRHEDPPKPSVEQRLLQGMTEGHAKYFIGRRREQQALLPKLRSGNLTTVLLTGLGGVGKSTLATRLARSLQKDGFTPIAVSSKTGNPLTAGRLLNRCHEVFLVEDADGPYQKLQSEEVDLQTRLRLLVQLLNRNRFTLVLDNFEENLDLESHEILDDTLTWFLPYLLENLTGDSRCLVTSRYRPVDLGEDLPPFATELPLTDLTRGSFFKYLLDDEAIEERYHSGDLSHDLLSRVYDLLGGTPRFLEQVREVLGDMSSDELADGLDTVDLPDVAEENRLWERRDKYVQDLFVDQLYEAIEPPEARTALSRAAVYTIPVTAEGYAAAADVDEDRMRDWIAEWQRRTFVVPVQTDVAEEELWGIPALLRTWFLERLDTEKRRSAHQAAGEWLDRYAEPNVENQLGNYWIEVKSEARSQFMESEDFENARRITDQISDLLVHRDFYEKAILLNEEVLEGEEHPKPMLWLGRSYSAIAEYGESEKWYRKAKKTADEDSPQVHLVCEHGLGSILLERGEYERARSKFQDAVKLQQEIGDEFGEAKARHQLANVDLKMGRYEKARFQYKRSLEISENISDKSGEAASRVQLATLGLKKGSRNYEEARSEFEQAIQIYQEIGARSKEASVRHQFASVLLEQEEYEEASEELGKVLRVRQEIGDRSGRASTIHQLATILLRKGSNIEAINKFEESLIIYNKIEDRKGEAGTQHQIASAYRECGEYEKAVTRLAKSLYIRQKIKDRAGEGATFANLGIFAAEDFGQLREGFWMLQVAYDILSSIDHKRAEKVKPSIMGIVSELGYSEDRLKEEVEHVRQSYLENQGWNLIKQSFDGVKLPDDVPSFGESK